MISHDIALDDAPEAYRMFRGQDRRVHEGGDAPVGPAQDVVVDGRWHGLSWGSATDCRWSRCGSFLCRGGLVESTGGAAGHQRRTPTQIQIAGPFRLAGGAMRRRPWKQAGRHAHQRGKELRGGALHGQRGVRLHARREGRAPFPAGADDPAGGTVRIHRRQRRRARQPEPSGLGLVLPADAHVAVRARAHQSRRDRQHADTAAGQLRIESFRQPRQRELADAVGQQVRHRDAATQRRDVHDPAAGPLEIRKGFADHVQRSPEVGADATRGNRRP